MGERGTALIQTLTLLAPEVVFGKANPNSCCVPNFSRKGRCLGHVTLLKILKELTMSSERGKPSRSEQAQNCIFTQARSILE